MIEHRTSGTEAAVTVGRGMPWALTMYRSAPGAPWALCCGGCGWRAGLLLAHRDGLTCRRCGRNYRL